MSPAKTAEAIKMPFGGLMRMVPINQMLHEFKILPAERDILGEISSPLNSIASLCCVVHRHCSRAFNSYLIHCKER